MSKIKNKIKVLVSGGAGYIGGAVTDILTERRIPFTVYDNLVYEDRYLKNVDFIFGDVRDTKKLKKILPNYTHVIWLAAIVGDAACTIRPTLTREVNRDAVEWLAKNFKGRIVFASTCSVYGEMIEKVDGTSVVSPLSLYAQTKLEAEKFLKDKNAIIFRLGTVFGVSDVFSRIRMDLAVNFMTAKAIQEGVLTIFGGEQWRPFSHVYNAAEAMVNSLDKPLSGIYNFATFNYKIRDLGKEIAKLTNCKVKYADKKFQDQRTYHVSTEKAKRDGLLRFRRILPIAYGVRQVVDLVSSGRVKYSDADVYFNERHIINLNNSDRVK